MFTGNLSIRDVSWTCPGGLAQAKNKSVGSVMDL